MSDPLQFLSAERLRKKLRPLLWTSSGGIFVAVGLRVWARFLWLPTLGITFLALIVLAFLFRPKRKAIAADLDARLGSKNRLETAEELAGNSSPLARAQREETARALKKETERRRFPVFSASTAGLAFLAMICLLCYDSVTWLMGMAHAQANEPKESPENRPLAEFRWKAPEAESLGTKVEEIPLTAEADSTSGLKEVALELRVNGEVRPPVPVSPDVQKELLKPGTHPLDLSIYLDELNVEAYDVVSYSLKGMRKAPQPLPPTVSPVQFIQIRPLREDVRIIERDGISRDAFNLIIQLKLAQLQLVKQNSVLTYADLLKTDPVWQRENGRVGEDQSVLADKVQKGLPVLIELQVDAEVIDLLTQAEPLMRTAATAIKGTENGKAIPDQEHALALITEAQKHFMKVVNLKSGKDAAKPPPQDPFKDQQRLQLPKREETAAGKLEQLAEKQAKLTDKLNQAKPDAAELAKEQQEVHEGIGGLSGKLETDLSKELTEAAEAARNSASQLEAKDTVAAKEPASRAAERLQSAVNKMLEEARKEALAALQKAQRELNHISDEMEQSGGTGNPQAAEKAHNAMAAVAGKLDEEALKQSGQGSALFANQLRDLASQLRTADPSKAAGLAQQTAAQSGTNGNAPGSAPANATPAPAPGSRPDASGKAPDPTANTGTSGNAPGNATASATPAATATSSIPKTDPGSMKEGSASSPPDQTDRLGSGVNELAQKLADAQARMASSQDLLQRSLQDVLRAKATLDRMASGKSGEHGITEAERAAGLQEILDTLKETAQRTASVLAVTQPGNGPGPGNDPGKGNGPQGKDPNGSGSGNQGSKHGASGASGATQAQQKLDNIRRPFTHRVTDVRDAAEPLDALIAMISKTLAEQQREQPIATGNPDQAPPAYREAVAKYFEQLSRSKAK
ncbi:MAG: hypothetical protein ACFUZC_08870 [Chthoniobacteraceae bacterium]